MNSTVAHSPICSIESTVVSIISKSFLLLDITNPSSAASNLYFALFTASHALTASDNSSDSIVVLLSKVVLPKVGIPSFGKVNCLKRSIIAIAGCVRTIGSLAVETSLTIVM